MFINSGTYTKSSFPKNQKENKRTNKKISLNKSLNNLDEVNKTDYEENQLTEKLLLKLLLQKISSHTSKQATFANINQSLKNFNEIDSKKSNASNRNQTNESLNGFKKLNNAYSNEQTQRCDEKFSDGHENVINHINTEKSIAKQKKINVIDY